MERKRLMSAEVEREFIKKLIEKTEDRSAEWIFKDYCSFEDKEASIKFSIYLSGDENGLNTASYIEQVLMEEGECTEIEIFISPTKELLDAIDFYMLENLKNKFNNGISESCKEVILNFNNNNINMFWWEEFCIIRDSEDYIIRDADSSFEIKLMEVVESKSDYYGICHYLEVFAQSFETETALAIEKFIKK